MLPPEAESVEENVNEPIDTPEEEFEQEGIPDGEDDWELAGEEIPGIPIPDDWVEEVNEPDQEPEDLPELDPDQWPEGDWADPEDLGGEEISGIPIPDDWVEVVEKPDQEPVETPEQESDQWSDIDRADPNDLSGEEILGIPIPDDWVEVVNEPDQEPVEIPEQESDQWPEGDWADPKDLAGEEIYPMPLPDDMVEIVGEPDQEPEDLPELDPDQWPEGDWVDPEDLAGEEISGIPIPDDWVEVVEKPDQEPEDVPELDSDQWPEGDWADPEDLAGEEIYPIPLPDDWIEIVEEPDQEPIESPIREENQEKEEIIVYANSENSSSDFLKLKSFIAEITAQKKSQDIQKSQEITRENQESKRELNSQKDEKDANKESKETKEKDFIINKETNEVKAEIKQGEETSSSTQNEKTQEISKELKKKFIEQTGRRPIYAGKITKRFEEWLKEQQESEKENQEEEEHEEIKEEWEVLLEKWINDADENEISKEIKDELIEIIKKYRSVRKLEKLLMDLLAKPNHTEDEIIEIEKLIDKVNELTDYLEEIFVTFERFKVFYNKNVIWSKDRITEQKIRFVKHLAQKLRRLKETTNDENTFLNYNWKAFIKENIDLIKDLNASDKELVSKIINKADISNEEREKLISILSKLDTEQLIKIFGESFKHHTKNYIRWGWDFDQAVKRLMLKKYFDTFNNKINLGKNSPTSEFIGIMLGDGNLYAKNSQYQLDVILNRVDDPNYFKYVKNLMKFLLNQEIKTSKHRGKAVSLRVYRKQIVNTLIRLGLVAGNKVKNQVKVPNFIFSFKNFIVSCLKGLFDTDGSISVDNKQDLRLSFQNCSKPLVRNFYKMCLLINIKPSPKINYSKKRTAWRVVIAKKDYIKKFLQIVKPEKFKEPYRRIWLASRLIYLNAPNSKRTIIEGEIKRWLNLNKKKQFQYSKENALFLKSTCEKILGIDINHDLINKTISQVLELKKYMYLESRAQYLKYLYEKLRSTLRIVEFLINQGEINIPYRQTIMKHIKTYFKEKNLDYNSWLSKHPKMRIGINNENQIRVFPNELRNLLCEMIFKILKRKKNNISNFEILKILKEEFIKSENILMTWFLNNPKYSKAVTDYIKVLIYLNKKLVDSYYKKEKVNVTLLSNDPDIPFHRKTITTIIDHLIKVGIM